MYDLELLSSLAVLSVDGIITETPAKIDSYYRLYDESFDREDEIQKKMAATLNIITKLFFNNGVTTNFFHRRVWFYTLYGFLFHQLYGLKNSNLPRTSKLSIRYCSKNIKKLKLAFNEFESKLERFEDGSLDPKDAISIAKFFNLHKTRTTSQKERTDRIDFLNSFIYGKING